MGLDIRIATENEDVIFEGNYSEVYFYQHSLSRTFCNLMSRRDVIQTGEPELDQIGQITGVDISALYDMNDYPEEESLAFFLSMAYTDQEKQTLLHQAAQNKAKLQGNIAKITELINQLIHKLTAIDNLPALLTPTDYDTLDNKTYFSNFTVNQGNGYIGNNFGQDLRNFKNFLEYAQSKGISTVYFNYG
ncbi:hypothetical protein [Mucilaginibacter paludis]|uniref:Uncharacterized protein n=1 Tax=Mucilaginibacter paludis DSM 18603 TaxID=714943 RepID=H1YB18_9SPHI|nr:hypothetical protein [Mucilaginibacter paludis]EHQ30051.1 hypothetical protein Mucpa_5992 [Mucilaginibacter paludis DSM 18603]